MATLATTDDVEHQLAALTTLPMGSVGNHLKVMLNAGPVLRRRAGRED